VTLSFRLALAGLVAVLLVAACGPSAASPSPSSSVGPSTVASAPPTAAPSVAPTAMPSPSATLSPTPAPSVAACAELPQSGVLPSDRFVDLRVTPGPEADRLVFVFGNASLPGPPSPPRGSLEVASPPYTQAGSGATIDVVGAHVLQIRFDGMSLANDLGQPTYDGPTDVRADGDAFRHAVLFDASEGVIGWYVGYNGAGCVTLVRDGSNLTLVIEHG
jgi:hypothetical protein